MDPLDELAPLEHDPLWYKDAVVYEVHVRAFHDSDADGIGDFRGLSEKLDYLQDLGVTAVWLLPFYPSPLRDDGYDIAEYTGIHPSYGTMRDFRRFLRAAHDRGIRVITEIVINHTSDQHPWFRRARKAPPGSPHRDFYVWSDTPERYRDARIIFQDTEASNWSWDPVAGAYYWHRFFSHQPDLNFDNPEVHRALLRVIDHWLDMGVDGLRLDAIPYLYEREGTMSENLPETHRFLKELRRHVDEKFENRMLLAEANQWPEDAQQYFGEGDECHMCFHFPLMPRLFMALRMENRFPIMDILQQTPSIPHVCQWALFLRNHDELTLEMVTDEERDYMYRAYAQDRQARLNLGIRRRLAPLLQNNRREIELMNALLFSLPGTPIIYYGDELGMGDNIYLGDRNGVRTPMQWSSDRNAGFSRANPQRLYLPVIIDPEYHYETVNVEAQQNNPHSVFWWTKRIIAQRKRFKVFGRGGLDFLTPDNPKVLAFLRRDEDHSILVVANLSRFVQAVELDLSEFEGTTPVELFGRTEFPDIGELPYFLTMGPHAFYWFLLQKERARVAVPPSERRLQLRGAVESAFRGRTKARVEALLAEDLPDRRWFRAKAHTIQSAEITEVVELPPEHTFLLMLDVEYLDERPQTYLIPVAFAFGEEGERVARELGRSLIARVQGPDGDGVLYHAAVDARFAESLLAIVGARRSVRGRSGEVKGRPTRVFRQTRGPKDEPLEPHAVDGEQSNTSIVYGERLIFKLFRALEPGLNPDLEIGQFLTERARFPHVPPVAGALEYVRGRQEPVTLGILQGYVPHQGDAWRHTLDLLGRYYEEALTRPEEEAEPPIPVEGHVLEAAAAETPEEALAVIGPYLGEAELLGRRTGELHLALASDHDDPAFAPERVTTLYQRSLYQSMRSLCRQTFPLLRRRRDQLPEDLRPEAERVLDLEPKLLERLASVHRERITAERIRVHGDYHLGQVLFTGKDFVIIDFEGEPARPLSERRLKRSPLRDVAGMLRSYQYAAYAAVFDEVARGDIGREPEAIHPLESWARFWHHWTSAAFLRGYLAVMEGSGMLPEDPAHLRILLDAFLLEKAVYEIGYELNNRPEWVRIPLQGILDLLRE